MNNINLERIKKQETITNLLEKIKTFEKNISNNVSEINKLKKDNSKLSISNNELLQYKKELEKK